MRRSTSPLTTLQVAATVSALLFAPLPAFAQGAPAPAPAPPAAAPPASAPAAPKPAAAPKTPPPPSSESRVPGSDIPTEAAPLPPWQPTPEPPVTAPPTDTPPAGTGTPEPPPVGTPPAGTPPAGTPPESGPPVAEGPAPAPAPAAAPVDPVKANKLRVAGIGTMIAGGVISLAGFAMILGFSVRGNKFEEKLVTVEDKYSEEGCSGKGGKACDALLVERTDIRNGILFSDYYTKLAGAGLAAGLLVTAIGGIVYRRGMKGLSNNVASVRVSPSLGGLSISGRF